MSEGAKLHFWPLDKFIEYARNPRKNEQAVDALADAVREFGFRVPIVAKSDGTIVDGHLRLKAARKLGMKLAPVLLADDLSEAQIKAFRISVNRMSELAEWDNELLTLELVDLGWANYDLSLTGLEADMIDLLLKQVDFEPGTEDEQPDLGELAPKFVVCPHCGERFDSRESA